MRVLGVVGVMGERLQSNDMCLVLGVCSLTDLDGEGVGGGCRRRLDAAVGELGIGG